MRRRARLRPPASRAEPLRRWARSRNCELDSEFWLWLSTAGRPWGVYSRLLRALWRNRAYRHPHYSLEQREALAQLRQAAHGVRRAMNAGDAAQMHRFVAEGDAAVKLLLIAELRPAAERGLAFMTRQLEKARFLKLARPLKAQGLSRAKLLDHPTVLLEFPNHDVRTLDRWAAGLYGQRPRGRPRKNP